MLENIYQEVIFVTQQFLIRTIGVKFIDGGSQVILVLLIVSDGEGGSQPGLISFMIKQL